MPVVAPGVLLYTGHVDTNEDIVYRSYLLNSKDIQANIVTGHGAGKGITGSVVDSVDFSDVDVIQFTEKRSEQDGMDAGDVFLGARRISMTGTLYGLSRGLLFDEYRAWAAALSPVLAQREMPADKGFCPLYFSIPTADNETYPTSFPLIPMRVLAVPRAKKVTWQRRQTGGKDTDPLALPWSATFLQRDPNIYAQTPQDYDLYTTPQGTLINRGSYIVRPNLLLIVGAAADVVTVTLGASIMTITVPASSGNRTIRYKGQDKVLTVEEGDVETLRFDLLDLGTQEAHPVILPGASGYHVSFASAAPLDGSRLWFWESYCS